MNIIERVSLNNEEYKFMFQYINFINKNLNIELIDGYICITDENNKKMYCYKTIDNEIYLLKDVGNSDKSLTYLLNILDVFEKENFKYDDASYLLMFIHLSNIEKDFKIFNIPKIDEEITEIIKIDIEHIETKTKGYIYNTKGGFVFYHWEDNNILFSSTGGKFNDFKY
jgi:hypothetical protein